MPRGAHPGLFRTLRKPRRGARIRGGGKGRGDAGVRAGVSAPRCPRRGAVPAEGKGGGVGFQSAVIQEAGNSEPGSLRSQAPPLFPAGRRSAAASAQRCSSSVERFAGFHPPRASRRSADSRHGAKVGPASPCPVPSSPSDLRLTCSPSATSCRSSWRLPLLLSASALLSAVTETRASTGKRPSVRVALAASAPWGSWFGWPAALLRYAPHSWT